MNDRLDESLRKMAQADMDYVPQSFSDRIDQVLQELPQKRKKVFFPVKAAGIAAAVIGFLVLLPNLSMETAYAMSHIPVIGHFFEAVTFRSYEEQSEKKDITIQIPEIIGEDDTEGAQQVSAQVESYINELMQEFHEDMQGDNYLDMHVGYEVVTNTEKWFTLDVKAEIIMASYSNVRKYYHIYVPTGQVMELSDLFLEGFDYRQAISAEIKEQMIANMEKNPDLEYWLDGENIDEDFELIEENHNFYFNEDGKLVIPFDKYEVGPGSIGNQEFVLESAIIYDNLQYQP